MALRYIDGFDHQSQAPGDINLVIKGPTGTVNDSTYGGTCKTTAAVRAYDVGQSLNVFSTAGFLTKIFDSQTTWIIGFHVNFNSSLLTNSKFLVILDGSTIQLTLYYNNSTQKLEVYRGDPTTNLLGSSTHTFAADTWYWVELKVLINGSTGTVELRVNGISEITLTAGNQNTQAGSNAYADRIKFCGGGSNVNIYFDNLYIADGTAGQNDFIGECRIITKYPTSNSSVTWTKSTGTTNFGCVDETPVNITDYVSSSTPAQVDKYGMSALGVFGTVKGTQICVVGKKDDAAPHTIRTTLTSGGTDYNGSTQSLDGNYRTFTKLYITNPAGGDWDVVSVDAALVGMELVS